MKLKIGSGLSLPLEAVTETFAILGRRGSGKTHTAVVMAEEMLAADVQVLVIDPLDVWWGLRVSKDGKSAGFPIYVCGGSHADVPLTADAGKVLADAIVDRGLSMVLSLRHLSKNDQRRFVGDFCERLYDRKAEPQHRTALHVFIDEADAFVPQRLMPGAERCFGAVDTLVRRGRSSGLAPTLISQRPQVINKDVLSQTEVLVSHQLTGPQDRKALESWIEANDTEDRRGEFMGSLASLARGTAWFWSPGFLNIFKPVDVRDRTTFDSSATPKAGVRAVASPKAFAAVDLEKLTADIAATIEKAKADDPRELRKQIADLKKQIGKPQTVTATKVETKVVDHYVLKDGQLNRIEAVFDKMSQLCCDVLAAVRKTQAPRPVQPITIAARVQQPRPVPQLRPARGSGESLPRGEKATLIAAAQYPSGVARDQLSVLTGYKRSSRDAYIQRLSERGYVDVSSDGIRATQAGIDALGSDFEPLPTGDALREWWISRLPQGERAVLEVAIEVYPQSVERTDIDQATEYKRSSRDAYIQRLVARRLVTAERGSIRASDDLFD